MPPAAATASHASSSASVLCAASATTSPSRTPSARRSADASAATRAASCARVRTRPPQRLASAPGEAAACDASGAHRCGAPPPRSMRADGHWRGAANTRRALCLRRGCLAAGRRLLGRRGGASEDAGRSDAIIDQASCEQAAQVLLPLRIRLQPDPRSVVHHHHTPTVCRKHAVAEPRAASWPSILQEMRWPVHLQRDW